MIVTMTKKYQTKSGNMVRLYALNGRKPYCVHGAIFLRNEWVQQCWTEKGMFNVAGDNFFDLIETWQPKDKEPILAWDNNYKYVRRLAFWDAKNQKAFGSEGRRDGLSFTNYAKVEHIEPWMIEAQKLLED